MSNDLLTNRDFLTIKLVRDVMAATLFAFTEPRGFNSFYTRLSHY